jgi:DnaJ-class molecular chaperone
MARQIRCSDCDGPMTPCPIEVQIQCEACNGTGREAPRD